MYPVSTAFHEAVFTDAPQRILLRFGDTLITSEDIVIDQDVKLFEVFNSSTELTIGACPVATLEATIINDHRLLSDFEFGECEASLSVRTETGSIAPSSANVQTIMRYGTDLNLRLEGFSTQPFLTINGEAPTAQPPMPIYAILTVGNSVYCIGEDGEVWAATWVDGRTWNYLATLTWGSIAAQIWDSVQGVLIPATEIETWGSLSSKTWDEVSSFIWSSFIDLPDLNPFMRRKASLWAQRRRGMSYNDNTLYEFGQDGRYEKYEYAKLGIFNVETPKRRRRDVIAITGEDRMMLFDRDATAFWDSLTYPITIGAIYTKLCAFVGVVPATLSFINSSRTLTKAPTGADKITAREILGWIAGAACANARMTRDGELELAWLTSRNVRLTTSRWSQADVAEYIVARIDKLQVLGAKTDIGVIVGSGANAYQLLDNPLLYGSSDAEIRALAVPIYNRLTAFAAFSPISVSAILCDWSVQAGDIIEFELDGTIYSLPVYSQTITWRSRFAGAHYSNSGSESRPEVSAQNRRIFAQNRAMHEFEVSVDGLKSRVSNAEGDITQLEIAASGLKSEVFNPDGSSRIQQQASQIALVVNPANNTIKAASIVAAINGSDSSVIISAGHINLNGIVTANNYFKINADGSMETIRAKIGGWNVDSTRIYSTNENVILNSNGSITAVSGTIGGWSLSSSAIYRGSNGFGAAGGQYFGSSGISLSNTFRVTSAGVLTAVSGTIGGWNVDSTRIYSTNQNVILDSSGTITAKRGIIGGYEIAANGNLSSNGLTANPNGRIDFGSYASIYSNPGYWGTTNTVLTSANSINIQSASGVGLTSGSNQLGVGSSGVSVGLETRFYLGVGGLGQATANARQLYVESDGRVMYSVSSIRYKENVRSLTDDDYDFNAFDPVVFNYINDESKRKIPGLEAEKVAEACSLLAITRQVNGMEIVDNYNPIALIPIVIREIQKIWATIRKE